MRRSPRWGERNDPALSRRFGSGSPMSGALSLEDKLALDLRACGVPPALREHRFAAPRRWRFDFAWRESMLAVEVQGGLWIYGRHQRPEALLAEHEKLAAAAALGWRVMFVSAETIGSGAAVRWIERALACGENEDDRA